MLPGITPIQIQSPTFPSITYHSIHELSHYSGGLYVKESVTVPACEHLVLVFHARDATATASNFNGASTSEGGCVPYHRRFEDTIKCVIGVLPGGYSSETSTTISGLIEGGLSTAVVSCSIWALNSVNSYIPTISNKFEESTAMDPPLEVTSITQTAPFCYLASVTSYETTLSSDVFSFTKTAGGAGAEDYDTVSSADLACGAFSGNSITSWSSDELAVEWTGTGTDSWILNWTCWK